MEGEANKLDWERWRGQTGQRLDGMDQARVLAKVEVDRRLSEMNKLRDQIAHERGTFVERAYYDARHDELRVRLERLERSEATGSGAISGSAAAMQRFYMFGSLLLAAIGALVVLLVHG